MVFFIDFLLLLSIYTSYKKTTILICGVHPTAIQFFRFNISRWKSTLFMYIVILYTFSHFSVPRYYYIYNKIKYLSYIDYFQIELLWSTDINSSRAHHHHVPKAATCRNSHVCLWSVLRCFI